MLQNPIHLRLEKLESWQHVTFMACLCERMYPNYAMFCKQTEFNDGQIYRRILDLVWESLTVKDAKINFDSQLEKFEEAIPVADDYDFILIDTGPHLDPFLLNGLAASDLILTPTPPAQVDFHSTLKYLTRLPEMLETLEEEGIEPRLAASIGFMSKMTGKPDHLVSHSLAREVYTSSILDSSLPRLDGFERCGETFDTIISANPASYPGSNDALKKARTEAEHFTKAVFDRIEFLRSQSA